MPEVKRPHRTNFLLNLSFECTPKFGEDYEIYLNKPMVKFAADPDAEVGLFFTIVAKISQIKIFLSFVNS